jgi:4-oxalomesaconate tautomerase
MGSPDPRQIDGMGGADPLTSKVAVVSPSARPGADVDYLFLQVFVDRHRHRRAELRQHPRRRRPLRDRARAGRGARRATEVRIFMVNTGQMAVATVETPGGRVTYAGAARIDGVPGTAAPVPHRVRGHRRAHLRGAAAHRQPGGRDRRRAGTLIDNGMPCVIMAPADFGLSGRRAPRAGGRTPRCARGSRRSGSRPGR